MIFAVGDHVEQIKKGTKTQTRRASDRYKVGNTYSIQPNRTAKGVLDGRILILSKTKEIHTMNVISIEDAKAEGGYTVEEFEDLYEKQYGGWLRRFVYTFRFVPSEGGVKGET